MSALRLRIGLCLLGLCAGCSGDDTVPAPSSPEGPPADAAIAGGQQRDAAVAPWPVAPPRPEHCAPGEIDCLGRCVDPSNDAFYCGASADCAGAQRGVVCAEGERCERGLCTLGCVPPEIECDGLCIGEAQQPCRRWSEPVLFEPTRDVAYAQVHLLAYDHAGNAFALLAAGGQGGHERPLMASRYDAAQGRFGELEQLSSSERDGIEARDGNVALGFDADGNALLVWSEELATTKRRELFSRRYDAASARWEDELAVKRDPISADWLQLAVQANGDAVLVWRRFDDIHSTYWWNRYRAGTGWETERSLELQESGPPALAADGQGNALIAYEAFTAEGTYVAARRLDAASAGWGEPVRVSEVFSALWEAPQITCDLAGSAIATWDTLQSGIWSSRYDHEAQAWSAPEQVAEDREGLWGVGRALFDGQGIAHLAWLEEDEAGVAVQHARWLPGAPRWDPPSRLALGHAYSSFSLEPTVDSAGNFTMLFVRAVNDARDAIVAAHHDAFVDRWGSPYPLVTRSASDYVLAPHLAVSPQGPGAALYPQGDDDSARLWLSLYR